MSDTALTPELAQQIAGQALAASDLPPELAAMVGVVLPTMEPMQLMALMGDALAARAKLDAGDRAGAQEIIERYRPMAESLGILPVFEEMFREL